MIRGACYLFATIAGLFLLYLAGTLTKDALPHLVGGDLLSTGYWDHNEGSHRALSMFYGTAVVSGIAILVAFPLGLGAAIYISEYLRGKNRAAVKIGIELLAGIPSVVYGLIGVAFVLPVVGPIIMKWGGLSGDTLLAAGCLLGVMILPTMMTFTDDALRCVPKSMREEGMGLGLSRVQVIWSIVISKARPGIVGATMLALGRSIGETIAIYFVIGRSDMPFGKDALTLESLLTAGQTLTTKLGGSELAIAYGDSQHWAAMMALGLSLWIVVGVLSLLGEQRWGRRV